ncbi:MAG: class I SAM-dependent methyltransferase [Anaerolineales bacterium]
MRSIPNRQVIFPMEHFPILYDVHHSAYQEDLSFWMVLAKQLGNPVLELGCGSGRVLLPLQKAGIQVFGLDHDFGMLTLLRQKDAAPIFCANMTDIPTKQTFALILLPCNTYSTLTKSQRMHLLQQVFRLLIPGGVFAVSLPNPWLLRALPTSVENEIEEIFKHPLDGHPLQVSSAWQRSKTHFMITWHYDHLFPDGTVERFSIEQSHSIQIPQDYEEEFRQANLTVFKKYGNFDQIRFRRTSPYLIYLVKKPE